MTDETYRTFITIHQPIAPKSEYTASFAIDERGELLETVDIKNDGSPDWESAGICDNRGEDPTLQAHIRTVLERLAATVPAGAVAG